MDRLWCNHSDTAEATAITQQTLCKPGINARGNVATRVKASTDRKRAGSERAGGIMRNK